MTSDQLLNQFEQRRRAALAEKLRGIEGIAGVDALLPTFAPAPLWHFWIDGAFGESSRGSGTGELESDVDEVTTGVYYSHFSSGATTGGYLNFRNIESNIPGQFNLDGDAVGISIFHIRPLGLGILGKILANFESGDANVAMTGATGSFDFTGWQIEGELSQHHDYGTWWMRSRTNLFYSVTDRDGFIDSNGAAVMGGETDTLRLSFGPTFGARYWAGDDMGWLAPYLGVEGEWDIVDEGNALAPSGTVINADPFNFRVKGGVNSNIGGLGTVTLEASAYGGGGGDDEGHEFKGTVNIPLN